MKRNKLIICFAIFGIGCSKTQDYKSIISELEKNAMDEKILQRKVANVESTKCLSEVFSVNILKAEIKELEKKWSAGVKVKGKWKHLNLENLSIPQGNFLNDYGKRLGDLNKPDAYDYSACKDVPCIINTIYGKPDSVAGYVHHLWYLKMGSYLTAHNTVYGGVYRDIKPGIYNEKPFEVSAYLWNDNELFAWWRLSHLLKSPHTDLKDLTEIQRVPRGENYGFLSDRTCGLAWSHGLVSLQDGCLGTGTDAYPGTFYDSVMHELTHQVDYHAGRKINKTYRSEENDYLDVAGFYIKEYVDEDKKTVRQWKHVEGAKMVTYYAGTSPAENFAETIANFRVNGSSTKALITEAHWNYTSKNYFFDKKFERSDFIKNWLTSESSLISQLAFKAVGNCTKESKGFESTYFNNTDFTSPLLATMVSCLGVKAFEISQEVKAKIKISDPDGCAVFGNYYANTEWESSFKIQLTDYINRYIKEIQTDKNYFAKIQSFYDEIPNRTIANNAFLSCSDLTTEESCYQENVLKLALEKLGPLNLPAAHADDLASLYLSSHEYADTKQYLTGYYRAFVESHKAVIDQEAKAYWEKCETLPLIDALPPAGTYFKVSDGYLVSSIYNCLNVDFMNYTNEIVRNFSVGDTKVEHPKEGLMLQAEVIPELQKSMASLYLKKREKENKAALEFIQNDNGTLREKILADFSWVKDVLNSENLIKDCQIVAISKIDFPLAYDTKAPVFGELIETACKNIHLAPEYTTWLEESKSVFSDKSITGLEQRISELATIKTKACVVKYPIDTNLNRIKFKTEREACLMSEWPSIEAAAIKEFEMDPFVIKFKIDIHAVKSQLVTNRRRLQLRVIKENF